MTPAYGGAMKYSLRVATALSETFDVDFYVCDSVSVSELKRMFEVDISIINVRKIQCDRIAKKPFWIPNFLWNKNARKLVTWSIKVLGQLEGHYQLIRDLKEEYDLLWETYLSVPNPADVTVIHYLDLMLSFLEAADKLAELTRKSKGLRKIVNEAKIKVYLPLILSLVKRKIFNVKNYPLRLVTSSLWAASALAKTYNMLADVIYYPVSPVFFSISPSGKKKVITISRYVKGKRLDFILDLAERMSDFEFTIVGIVNDQASESYFQYLLREVDERGLSNVRLVRDASNEELLNEISSSSVYFHPPYPEHFGIAVAEAVAAGLPPVVYKDGGAWYDITKPLDENLGYDNLEGAERAIRYAYKNLQVISKRAKEYAKRRFDEERFVDGVISLSRTVVTVKNIVKESRTIMRDMVRISERFGSVPG